MLFMGGKSGVRCIVSGEGTNNLFALCGVELLDDVHTKLRPDVLELLKVLGVLLLVLNLGLNTCRPLVVCLELTVAAQSSRFFGQMEESGKQHPRMASLDAVPASPHFPQLTPSAIPQDKTYPRRF